MKIKKHSIIKPPYNIKQIKLGDKKKFGIKINKNLHHLFSKFSGDKSPLHTSKKFCEKNGFKDLVGYAFLIDCILSKMTLKSNNHLKKIYGMYFPGGSELCLQHTSKFIKPYYINDYLNITITVTQKNFHAKLITLDVKINTRNNLIFEGETLLKLPLEK